MDINIYNKLEMFIITFNRKDYLKKTLDNILNSPVKDLDITILDNCSNDGTENLVSEYNKLFKNIKYIKQNRNIGGNANIVSAYINASKEYVWVICDDDNLDWSNWKNIEKLILENNFDVIMLNPTKNNLANIMVNATFTPSQIYKTKWIDSTTVENMYCNIPNFFPHLAIISNIINNNGKIFTNEKWCLVNRGNENDNSGCYVRGLEEKFLFPKRRDMFWFVGYLNSLALLNNKKNINFILDNTNYVCNNFFELLTYKIALNRYRYNNSIVNLVDIFIALNSKWRIIFPTCFILSYFLKNNLDLPQSIGEWVRYIKKNNIEKHLNKICKNKKKVIIYGIGMIFEALIDSGADLSHIKYISDTNYSNSLEKYDIEVLRADEINNINPDCIIVAPKKQFNNIKKQLRKSGIKCQIKSLIK